MKTPEEIKDALDTCGKRRICLSDCPYFGEEGCNAHLEEDALDLIQQLEAQAPKWISVEERLPPTGKAVLVYVNNAKGVWPCVTIDAWDGSWVKNADSEWHIVSHWMPLPEPPKEEEK